MSPCRLGLVFQSHLDSLTFLVQVDVRNVVSVEGEVLLSHSVGVQGLIHPISTLPWPSGHASPAALGARLILAPREAPIVRVTGNTTCPGR